MSVFLSLLPSIIQGVTGLVQSISGSQDPERTEPIYKVPQEIKDLKKIAEFQAGSNMPGYNYAKGNIEHSSESALSKLMQTGRTGADILGGITSVELGKNQALNQLAGQNEQYSTNAINNYMNRLMGVAPYSQRESFDDPLRRYQEETDTLAALKGGGLQNLMGAGSSAVNNYLLYKMIMGDNKSGIGKGSGQDWLSMFLANKNWADMGDNYNAGLNVDTQSLLNF